MTYDKLEYKLNFNQYNFNKYYSNIIFIDKRKQYNGIYYAPFDHLMWANSYSLESKCAILLFMITFIIDNPKQLT